MTASSTHSGAEVETMRPSTSVPAASRHGVSQSETLEEGVNTPPLHPRRRKANDIRRTKSLIAFSDDGRAPEVPISQVPTVSGLWRGGGPLGQRIDEVVSNHPLVTSAQQT